MADQQTLDMLNNGRDAWNSFTRDTMQLMKHGMPLDDVRAKLNLARVDLQKRDLSFFRFYQVDLSGADLRAARLDGAHLVGTSLRGTDLSNATLREARLEHLNMGRANCRGANFGKAVIRDVDASGADLSSAILIGAILEGIRFRDTNIEWAYAGRNTWAACDLRGLKGLHSVRHSEASSLGMDCILASEGQMPEAFLRGCGLPNQVTAYVQALGRSKRPFDWYSCFISYSSKDSDFCDRLHADLQAAGVRCWFAPEDLKIGDPFRDEIERAIRVHDKLLLVLSERSVTSTWVETEVESAFRRERDGSRVLFPIRLDDAVLQTDKAWAAHVQQSRHIGDFTGWKDHDRYQKAFQRLLRDLKGTPNRKA